MLLRPFTSPLKSLSKAVKQSECSSHQYKALGAHPLIIIKREQATKYHQAANFTNSSRTSLSFRLKRALVSTKLSIQSPCNPHLKGVNMLSKYASMSIVFAILVDEGVAQLLISFKKVSHLNFDNKYLNFKQKGATCAVSTC